VARRIVLAVLALVIVALSAVALPLGLVTANQDRRDYQIEALASAVTLANVAEEHLDDHINGPALGRTVRQLGSNGDRVSVLSADGRRIAGTAARPPVTAAQLSRAGHARMPAIYEPDDWLLAVMPVLRDSRDGHVGAVVLARPTAPVSERIARLWSLIAAACAAALLAAALVAVALAGWVNRPLRQLEAAAAQLGGGDLGTRSASDAGPAEVRGLAQSFNQMAARLESLVHGHRAMMADVSHQLRTPLAALRLRLDVLAQDSDPESAAELAGAQEEIARLSRLVNGLLAVARAENVSTVQVLAPLDQVIGARVAAWQPAAEERAVLLRADLEPAGVRVGDGHLEQILDNLIANALDALPEGGTVTLTCSLDDGWARIVVRDDGPGMTAEQQRLAFRRFAGGGPGAGLGLAIVHRLAVSNGGSAALSDTPGGGLTVTIKVPAAVRERTARGG
jgi:signal transduction histidine kinase